MASETMLDIAADMDVAILVNDGAADLRFSKNDGALPDLPCLEQHFRQLWRLNGHRHVVHAPVYFASISSVSLSQRSFVSDDKLAL